MRRRGGQSWKRLLPALAPRQVLAEDFSVLVHQRRMREPSRAAKAQRRDVLH